MIALEVWGRGGGKGGEKGETGDEETGRGVRGCIILLLTYRSALSIPPRQKLLCGNPKKRGEKGGGREGKKRKRKRGLFVWLLEETILQASFDEI